MSDREILSPDFTADLLRQQAANNPDKIGLIFEGREFTFSQMNDRANMAAAALKGLGIGPGDRVVWLAQNVALFWDVFLGAAKIGAVMTPINWRLAPAEIGQILGDAQAAILIGETMFIEPLDPAVIPEKSFTIETGPGSFDALVDAQEATEPDYQPHLDDAFLQLYTSGTTGLPKGVVLSHRAYKSNGDVSASERVMAPDFDNETALHALPHFHIAGVNFGLMAMARGMPTLQMRQFDPAGIVRALQDDTPMSAFLVPAMIMMIMEAAKQAGASLANFTKISYGAAPMPAALLDAAMTAMPNTQFMQFYGSTENCGAVTRLTHEHHKRELKHCASAGKPWPGTDVKVCDPESGKEMPVHETGEIWMRSGAVMDGYWRREEATAETFADDWFRTGDAGYFDENGYLYVCDRVKDMIISGGENIYPAEIENALSLHPAVLESAVIGAPDEKWGEIVKAIVVKRPDADLTGDEVIGHLADHIAKFKLPRSVEFMDALPRNPSGKILKTELRKTYC